MPEHKIHPHGPLEELAPGIWRVLGRMPFPLQRNMIVVRLPGDELLLHSVVALDENGMAALERLGRPAYAIVPSANHVLDAPFYRARYPAIQILAPAALRDRISATVPVDGTVEDVLPRHGIVLHPVPSTKSPEHVYEVPMPAGGRMLMVNDALGNIGAGAPGFVGRHVINRMMVPKNGPRVARLYGWTQATDVAAINRFFAGLGEIPDIRLITVAHGEPIRETPAAKLKALAQA